MKLPNVHLATVPEKKITDYLLNPGHPAGGSKAAFFLRFGFSETRWQDLADALLRHARENEVVAGERTRHGNALHRGWCFGSARRNTIERS